jgi:hypothetical protein
MEKFLMVDEALVVINVQQNFQNCVNNGIQHILVVGVMTGVVYHVVSAPLLSERRTIHPWSSQMEETLFDILKEIRNPSGFVIMDRASNHGSFCKTEFEKKNLMFKLQTRYRSEMTWFRWIPDPLHFFVDLMPIICEVSKDPVLLSKKGPIIFGGLKSDFDECEERKLFLRRGRAVESFLSRFYHKDTLKAFGVCLNKTNKHRHISYDFLCDMTEFYDFITAKREIDKIKDVAFLRKLHDDYGEMTVKRNIPLQRTFKKIFKRLADFIEMYNISHTDMLSTLVIEEYLLKIRGKSANQTAMNCIYKDKFEEIVKSVDWGGLVLSTDNYTSSENMYITSNVRKNQKSLQSGTSKYPLIFWF